MIRLVQESVMHSFGTGLVGLPWEGAEQHRGEAMILQQVTFVWSKYGIKLVYISNRVIFYLVPGLASPSSHGEPSLLLFPLLASVALLAGRVSGLLWL